MEKTKINRILIKIREYSGISLFFLFLLYFLSGFGQAKGIFDPIIFKKIHSVWLPTPTFLLFLLHSLISFKFLLLRFKIKDDFWLNFSLFSLGTLLFLFFLYFYLL